MCRVWSGTFILPKLSSFTALLEFLANRLARTVSHVLEHLLPSVAGWETEPRAAMRCKSRGRRVWRRNEAYEAAEVNMKTKREL